MNVVLQSSKETSFKEGDHVPSEKIKLNIALQPKNIAIEKQRLVS